eukprot:Skav210302  [mRNA]  locus=scaffold475:162642:164912:- [translate_table: standard]
MCFSTTTSEPIATAKHQEEEVALAVLRLFTVPALHRLSCLQAVHRVLHNILADPESAFSLLDEVLRDPDAWIPAVGAAMPEVTWGGCWRSELAVSVKSVGHHASQSPLSLMILVRFDE